MMPAARLENMRNSTLNGLLAAAAVVIIIVGLRQIAPILTPVLVAVFVSILCIPPLHWLQTRGLPFVISLSIILLVLCLLGLVFMLAIGGSVQSLVGSLSEFQDELIRKEQLLADRAGEFGISISRDQISAILDPRQATAMVGHWLESLARAFSNSFVVLIMIVFILTEATSFPHKLRAAVGSDHLIIERLGEIVANVRRYIAIKTVISIATGISIGILLRLLGVEFAILWGFVAFLFNYIPSIGSLLAGIPAVAIALVFGNLALAFWVALSYFVVNTVFGSLVEPRLQGRGLGLSPFVVFVSLFVWGWALGPVGMVLSAPLTMVVKIVLDHHPDTRWLAVLLGTPNPAAQLTEKA